MKNLLSWVGALTLALVSVSAASAQAVPPIATDGTFIPATGLAFIDGSGVTHVVSVKDPIPTIGKQESFALIKADVAVLSATVAGGDYALSQVCATYGTLNLQVLGPDGSTWLTLISKTAADTAGATGLSLGSYATVRITTSGATGCNAILARIPA